MITKEQLLEFDMTENKGEDAVIYPFEKVIAESEEEEDFKMSIVVTNERNTSELALILPEGDILYLGGIRTLDDLRQFESYITEYEPNF